jgi:hypothetical protein
VAGDAYYYKGDLVSEMEHDGNAAVVLQGWPYYYIILTDWAGGGQVGPKPSQSGGALPTFGPPAQSVT